MQPRSAFGGPAARPPHPATVVQPRPALGGPAAHPPHPATVVQSRRVDAHAAAPTSWHVAQPACCWGRSKKSADKTSTPVATTTGPELDPWGRYELTIDSIDSYLDRKYPMPPPRIRDKSLGEPEQVAALKELLRSDGVATVVARGLKRQSLTGSSGKVYEKVSSLASIMPEDDKQRATEGRHVRAVGGCDWASDELADYLNSCGYGASSVGKNSGRAVTFSRYGTHAFAWVRFPATTIIVDPTWQQYLGKLELSWTEALPSVMAGTIEEIETLFSEWGAESVFAKALVGFYKQQAGC